MRPMIAFLVRLIALDANLTATLITAESAVNKAQVELTTQLASEGIDSTDTRLKYVLVFFCGMDNVLTARCRIVPVAISMFWPTENYLSTLKEKYSEVIAEKEPDLALLEVRYKSHL